MLVVGLIMGFTSAISYAQEGAGDAQKPQDQAAEVVKNICPLSGEVVGENLVEYKYKKKAYKFCCKKCLKAFKKNKKKYTPEIADLFDALETSQAEEVVNTVTSEVKTFEEKK